jgi:hypothetical protein
MNIKFFTLIPSCNPMARQLLSEFHVSKLMHNMLHHNIAGVVEAEQYLGLLDEANKLLGLIAYNSDDRTVTIVAHANGDVVDDSFTELLVALQGPYSLHEVNIIISNDFNQAQTLSDLGFTKKSEIDPEFSYVVRGKRRLQVEDPTKFPRIWDAGKIKMTIER